MKEELELQLEQDFPFMKRNKGKDEENLYKRWGCECSGGWYQLLHDLCQEITDRYAQENMPIDIVIDQVKEKFGTLRFYYSFEDTPCAIHAFDFLGDGSSIRFQPGNKDDDEPRKSFRRDLAQIVRRYEKKSGTVCEVCGKAGALRTDMPWIRTLCDECQEARRKKAEENKLRRKKIMPKDFKD